MYINNSNTKPEEANTVTSYGGSDQMDPRAVGDKIKERINLFEKDCKDNYERAKENRKYATNNFDASTDEKLLAGEPGIYIPKIREDLETVVPSTTQKTPEPDIRIRSRNGVGGRGRKTDNISRLTIQFLKDFWETDSYMQKRMEQAIRIYFCQAFIAFKVVWNPLLKRPDVYVVPMGNLIFPIKDTKDPDKLPFVIEKVSDSIGNIKKKFYTTDGVLDEERFNKLKQAIGSKNSDNDTLHYHEYWENQFVAWMFKDEILDIMPNPNFLIGEENHFPLPEMPYIFENCYSFGDGIADDTTPIETTKSLQDNINRTKRQIALNQDDANGQMVINGDLVSDEDSDKIDRSRQNKIIAKSPEGSSDPISLGNVAQFISSRGMGAEVTNNLAHDENHVDNEFSTHAVSRGEQQSVETATGRQVLKDSDKEKNSTLTRMVERISQKIMNHLIQLVYVYGDEDMVLFSETADTSVKSSVSRELYKGYIVRIQVKDGSTVPRNPAVLKAEIVDLAKSQLASLLDMYRDLGYDDPEGRAKRAMMEKDPNLVMQLYGFDGNLDVFNTAAVIALEGIIDGTYDPAQIYDVDDLKIYKSYLKTLTDYLAGKEVDLDLDPFNGLDPDTMSKIQQHVQLCLNQFDIMQKQQMQDVVAQQKNAEYADALNPLDATENTSGGGAPSNEQVQVSNITGNTEATPMSASPQTAAVVPQA